MSDIPEEIMEEARRIAREGIRQSFTDPLSPMAISIAPYIARALISAEARGMERAAKIADEHARLCDVQNVVVDIGREQFAFRAIAAAIRNGTEA